MYIPLKICILRYIHIHIYTYIYFYVYRYMCTYIYMYIHMIIHECICEIYITIFICMFLFRFNPNFKPRVNPIGYPIGEPAKQSACEAFTRSRTDMFRFQVAVFWKQAKYEQNIVFSSSLHVFKGRVSTSDFFCVCEGTAPGDARVYRIGQQSEWGSSSPNLPIALGLINPRLPCGVA